MDRLRFGVVGAVARGSEFVKILVDHPNAEVVALCDVQEEALGVVAAQVAYGDQQASMKPWT